MAKWKGPFTITKVPNRFQIEYLEDGISRTTHISYAKRFYERSLNVQTKRLHHRLSREQDVITMAHLRLVSGSGKNRRRLRAFSLKEICKKWHYFSGPMPVRIKICGPVEVLPEGLRTLVDEAGATQVIIRGRLLDLCGQRSYEEGGSCDGSSVQAVCEDLALSQEDDPEAPADQVGNLYHDCNLTKTCEIPMWFKSMVGYNAKNTNLDSFQTKSGSFPKLLALVRKISQKEWPTCKYQQHYVFRHKIQTSVRKQRNRPMRFKLAYAQNASNRNKEGFGIKSCKKAKIYRRKADDKFWNPYVFLIMCITMTCIYLRKVVNKCNLWDCQQSTAVSINYMRKVKWPQNHARWVENVVIIQMVIFGIHMDM